MSSARCRAVLFVVSVMLGLVAPRPSTATVLLKPKGENAVSPRTKALAAEVTIERQFATTRVLYTFRNETEERIEARKLGQLSDGCWSG